MVLSRATDPGGVHDRPRLEVDVRRVLVSRNHARAGLDRVGSNDREEHGAVTIIEDKARAGLNLRGRGEVLKASGMREPDEFSVREFGRLGVAQVVLVRIGEVHDFGLLFGSEHEPSGFGCDFANVGVGRGGWLLGGTKDGE
jgi:hypothetical protein